MMKLQLALVIKEQPDLVIAGGEITGKEVKMSAAAAMEEFIKSELVHQV